MTSPPPERCPSPSRDLGATSLPSDAKGSRLPKCGNSREASRIRRAIRPGAAGGVRAIRPGDWTGGAARGRLRPEESRGLRRVHTLMPEAPLDVDHAHGIATIDARFVAPGAASSHLILEHGRAAFVDVGTAHTTPHLLAALAARDLDVGDVDWVLPTHVHLDHAGGAGTLMRALPNARLVAHPRAARHLVDPTRLVESATGVYGAEEFARLFGEVVPVAAERVVEAPDGFAIALAGRRLRFLDTPGHARHHYCVWDEASRGIFTGDCFGISYRWADTVRGPWTLPTTTPVQFDPPAMHATLERLMALDPRHAYLTHWGRVGELARLAADLHRMIDAMVELARTLAGVDHLHEHLVEALFALYLGDLRAHGCTLSDEDIRARLAMDLELNAQGLEVWLTSAGT